MYIAKQPVNGKDYYYLRKSVREGDKVRSKSVAYLGKTKEEAEKKFKEMEKKENKKIEKEPRDIGKFPDYNYDRLMELASRKSLFYPAAEIYPNSPKGFWDFGPIGQAIRRKIVDFWRHELIQKENMLEIHGSQILPATVFEGSGHLKSFADPIVYCKKCKKFYRADQLISEKTQQHIPESTPTEKLDELILNNNIRCECKGEFGKVSKFNMMVETIVGKQGDAKTFLRPEACQSIFLNFSRMVKTMRLKLPQGIAQVGGAFRNEISPRQSITRSVEFSQMEAEIFFDSEKINDLENFSEIKDYPIRVLLLGKEKVEDISANELVERKIVPGKLIAYFLARTQQVWNNLGIPLDKMRFREVDKDERAFYSLSTFDFEVETSLGWLELIANNYRTDYDLKGHMTNSKTDLTFLSEENKKIVPHIWEISAGVDRTLFAVIENSFRKGKDGIYLSLNPLIAPYHCAIFPLIKEEKILDLANSVKTLLQDSWFDINYDASGSIGRRYARQDEIGTPYCITIDGDSSKNNDVTIRDRDTTKQIRVKISELKKVLRELINNEISFEKAGKIVV